MTVLQLTPKVYKDTYLFVSELRVIYFDIPIVFLTELIVGIGNFENCFNPFQGMFLCCIVLSSI